MDYGFFIMEYGFVTMDYGFVIRLGILAKNKFEVLRTQNFDTRGVEISGFAIHTLNLLLARNPNLL